MFDEQEEKKVTQYLVPANVSTKFEFFPGFGWYEFKIVVIAGLIGLALAFLIGLPKKNVPVKNSTFEQTIGAKANDLKYKKVSIVPKGAQMLAVLLPCFAAFFVVKRDPSTNMSVIALAKNAREFKKNQKLYLYRYNSGSEVK